MDSHSRRDIDGLAGHTPVATLRPSRRRATDHEVRRLGRRWPPAPSSTLGCRGQSEAPGSCLSRDRPGRDQRTRQDEENRYVLLNDRALHALAFAEQYAERRKAGTGAIKDFPYVFPPSKMIQHVRQSSDLHKQWGRHVERLEVRYRRRTTAVILMRQYA